MTALPCVGRSALYDLALFEEDADPRQRQQAVHRAAALCAGCPAPCPEKVTADSGPRELVLLEPDWMPPAREGQPEPKPTPRRKWSADRRKAAAMTVGRDYVPTDRRADAWARAAAEHAAAGMPLAQIAERLCVTEQTAADLITHAQQQREAS
ncbi:hypothetical protein F0L17_14265 [Streptomyces sp. TRM43335]|uniref:Uncharacterized protein n=1 Tax=Streptomyces taklimakanensis TaxID=2569853 RepID=A0A6G2BEC1_9ACTN|nr:hypothetical protein [Streptomyces taklimakanensis]MTE20252.1 hypothetical protein [Streptomyces taklimakanensis]